MKLGLLGHHISYSLSPVIHKMIGSAEIDYEILDVPEDQLAAELPELVRSLSGFNVTIPHKQAIMAFCNKIDPAAKMIGAVNTVDIRQGYWTGYNTDYLGFIQTMKSDCPDYLSYHPVIVGYGGVARAVIFGLMKLGFGACSVLGGEYDHERHDFIEDMRRSMDVNILDHAPEMPRIWINGTPVGGAKIKDIPENFIAFKKGDILLDLNYTPYPTHLELYARNRGIKTINGLRMLVFQAIEAEKIWHKGDANLMCNADIIIDTIVHGKSVS